MKSPRPGGRHYAYALCTDAEHALIRERARAAGLSMSDYMRRCINSMLLEEGDEVPLLEERRKEPKARA